MGIGNGLGGKHAQGCLRIHCGQIHRRCCNAQNHGAAGNGGNRRRVGYGAAGGLLVPVGIFRGLLPAVSAVFRHIRKQHQPDRLLRRRQAGGCDGILPGPERRVVPVLRDSGDLTGLLRPEVAIPVQLCQRQHGFLQLLPQGKQPVICKGVPGILQSNEPGSLGYLLVEGYIDPGHPAGKAGNPQLAVDIEGSGAQRVPFAVRDNHGIFTGGGIIGGGHRRDSVQKLGNSACLGCTVRQCHRYAVSRLQVPGRDIHRHETVQRQQHQCATVIHHIGGAVLLLNIDCLDPAGCRGADQGIGGFPPLFVQVLVQLLQYALQPGNGRGRFRPADTGKNIPGFHHTSVFHMVAFHADGIGDFRLGALRTGQGPRPGQHRTDCRRLRLGGKNPGIDQGLRTGTAGGKGG